MRRVVFLVAILLSLPGWGQPATTEPASPKPARLTLERAFARALAANPTMGLAEAGIGVAEAQRRLLFSAVLPEVTVSGRLTRNSEEAAFGEGANRRAILLGEDWNARISLSQPIYAGGRELRAYEQAKLLVDSARLDLVATREDLLLRVAADFLGVVQGDALVEVERRGVELASDLVAQAKSFELAGEVTGVEVRRAEVGLKAAERRLAAARRQRGTAASRLWLDLALDGERATYASPLQPDDDVGARHASPGAGHRPGDDVRAMPASPGVAEDVGRAPAGPSELVVEAPDPALFATPLPREDELVARCLAHRPEVLAARNDVAVAQLEVRKQRGARWPVVTFDAFYLEQRSPFPSDGYGSASINVSVPLFDSGATSARVHAASERENQARLALAAVEQGVRDEIRRALLDVDTAETSLGLATEQVAAAQAEFDQTFDLYQAQEATALDVRQAETALAEARRAVVESSLARDLARARVWYVAGSLAATVLGEDAP